MRYVLFLLLSLTTLHAAADTQQPLPWTLLRTIPRTHHHFTQGLVFSSDTLLESTGRYGQSAIYLYDKKTLQVQKKYALPVDVFGEGLTVLQEKIYQASWQSQQLFVYNSHLQPLKTLPLQGEGWGLTSDGTALILSDGSDTLQYLDPVTGKPLHSLRVKDSQKPWNFLNELEWIDGYIFANVWHSNTVLCIDSQNGNVIGIYDFSTLSTTASKLMPQRESEDVLNGLAWQSSSKTLWVTGKNWPVWFEVKIKQP
jgi:glutamine cyclotransferase